MHFNKISALLLTLATSVAGQFREGFVQTDGTNFVVDGCKRYFSGSNTCMIFFLILFFLLK